MRSTRPFTRTIATSALLASVAGISLLFVPGRASSSVPGVPPVPTGSSGRAEGAPTYTIASDGTVDWSIYEGFRRYHAACHACHGPDGEGGSFAPSLLLPVRSMSYDRFRRIVSQGSRSTGVGQQQVMGPMADDPNVMCFVDAIYAYLKARADGTLGRGRPDRHETKPEAALRSEAACLGR